MARYEHLPIYKRAYDMTLYFENTIRHFSRYNKFTLGTELREHSRAAVNLIRKANNSYDKLKYLFELREILEQMKFTLHLCKDVKAFNNFNSFKVAINHVINVSNATLSSYG